MKQIQLVVFTIAALFSIQSYAEVKYNPSDVDTFLKTGKCPSCDLSGANIGWQTMSNIDVNHAILTEATLAGSNYASGNFSNANMLSANIQNVNFSGSNFSDAVLNSAWMGYGNFSRCDFTGADLSGAVLAYAILIQSKLTPEQLASAKTLSCAIMPDGTRHPSDTGGSC